MLRADSHLRDLPARETSRALREVSPEEVTDEDLSEIMTAVDQITLTLQRIVRRREREQVKKIRL